MKLKKIISRKDHEIYFIPVPQDLRSNAARKYVFDALSELHPGFSSNFQVDIKYVVYNKKHWFLVTVIAVDVLEDYRIMYRGALFFTNTSILAFDKLFSKNKPVTVDDELIGFDSENNIPVSLPLETSVVYSNQSLTDKLKCISSRCIVFKKNNTKWLIVSVFIFAAVLVMFLLAPVYPNTFNQKHSGGNSEHHLNPWFFKQPEQIVYMPSAIALLAGISELFLKSNGEIEGWKFNEGETVTITIQSRNISALMTHTLFNNFQYMALQDIQIVNYSGGKPQLTVLLNAKNDYSLPESSVFEDKNSMFTQIAELTDLLTNFNIEIMSEILPSAANNYLSYTVSFKTDNISIVKSMAAIEEYCEKYSMRIKNLDVSAEADKKTFFVSCTLSRVKAQNGRIEKLDAGKESIPLAFGYKPAQIKKIENFIEEKPVLISMAQDLPVVGQIIGSITDLDGKKIFFHNSDGKISIRSE